MKRVSIYSEGFSHKNPIPAACRIGNVVHTGSILGTCPVTGRYGETLEEQCRLMFEHVDRIIRAAGGTPENIIKMTVWMKDRNQRQALNVEWLKMFPDEHSRPARHTMDAPLDGGKLIECSFVAVLDQSFAVPDPAFTAPDQSL